MSSTYRRCHYKCGNDCRQSGCPGHDLKIHYHHTSDTVTIYVDEEHYVTFDDVMFSRIVALDKWHEGEEVPC